MTMATMRSEDMGEFIAAAHAATQAERAAYLHLLHDAPTRTEIEDLKLSMLANWAEDDDELDDHADEAPAPPVAPPFPVHALPEWAQDYVLDVARNLQTPVDLPAQIALGVLSAVCNRNRCTLEVGGTWVEGANLYLAIAMPPGAGKSPAFTAIANPLEIVAEAVAAEAQHAMHKRQAQRLRLEKRLKEFEKELEKSDDHGDQVLEDYADAKAALTAFDAETDQGRLLADDVTPEALVRLVGANGGRIALLSTEGGMFDNLGRYAERGKAPNLDGLLKIWSGDTIRVDRAGGLSLQIKDPRAVVCLTVQPSTVAKVLGDAEFQGRGLVARFMISQPESYVGTRDMLAARDVDDRSARAWADGVSRTHGRGARPLAMSGDASFAFHMFRQSLESRRFIGGDLEVPWLTEMSTKCESSVARVALILAVAEGAERVELDHVNRAITIGHYWLGQALALVGEATKDALTLAAERVLKWAAGKRKERVSVRDIQRSGAVAHLGFKDADEVLEVFERIEADGDGTLDWAPRSPVLELPDITRQPDTHIRRVVESEDDLTLRRRVSGCRVGPKDEKTGSSSSSTTSTTSSNPYPTRQPDIAALSVNPTAESDEAPETEPDDDWDLF